MPVFLLSDAVSFPPPHFARKDGLLAIGGDLSKRRLLLAYKMGIFPWFSDNEPILWWSPDPRLVLYPSNFHVSGSLKKIIKKKIFSVTFDKAFEQVINACAKIRTLQGEDTWITDKMIIAYCKLHESGFAHSAEAWHEGKLVGGLYGVSIGRSFFGESMFTLMSNASKVALTFLVEFLKNHSFDLIDCQQTTANLIRFGAEEMPRSIFLKELKHSLSKKTLLGKWTNQ